MPCWESNTYLISWVFSRCFFTSCHKLPASYMGFCFSVVSCCWLLSLWPLPMIPNLVIKDFFINLLLLYPGLHFKSHEDNLCCISAGLHCMHPKSLSISKKGNHSTSNTGCNCWSLLIHAHGIELLLCRRNHSFPLTYPSRWTYIKFQKTQNISPLGFLPLQHTSDTWYDQWHRGSSSEFF